MGVKNVINVGSTMSIMEPDTLKNVAQRMVFQFAVCQRVCHVFS